MGGISIYNLLIIALVVLLVFGSGKLRSLGSDLGEAIKGFKKAVNTDDDINAAKNEQIQEKIEKDQSE